MPNKPTIEKFSPDHRERRSVLTELLEKLQQESWQLELLISGFAILGCLEALKVVERAMVTLLANHHGPTAYEIIASLAWSVLATALSVFIINLIAHVVTRALWIGAIGLRYVSGEIDHSRLPYNLRFKAYFRSRMGSFDDYIDMIGRFSSIIFAYTFLLVFGIFAFYVFLTIPIALAVLAFSGSDPYTTGQAVGNSGFATFLTIIAIFTAIAYTLLGLVVAFDFLTLGLLKRIKKRWFVRAYLPIYRFYSFMTLSFIWRPLLLNFLDERFTRRMFRCTVPYVIAVTVLPTIGNEPYGFHPTLGQLELEMGASAVTSHYYWFEFYDDLVVEDNRYDERSVIKQFSIPSKKVSGPLFEVFVKYTEADGKVISTEKGVEPVNETGVTYFDNEFSSVSNDSLDMAYSRELDTTLSRYNALSKNARDPQHQIELTAEKAIAIASLQRRYRADKEQTLVTVKELLLGVVRLEVDGTVVPTDAIAADFYTHPRHGERGMLCFFPLDSLAVGRHTLSIVRRPESMEWDHLLRNTTTIPFIYTGQ